MDTPTTVSPFVIADAYRIGQSEGFKTGIAAGVVLTVLVSAALKNHRRRRLFKNQKNK